MQLFIKRAEHPKGRSTLPAGRILGQVPSGYSPFLQDTGELVRLRPVKSASTLADAARGTQARPPNATKRVMMQIPASYTAPARLCGAGGPGASLADGRKLRMHLCSLLALRVAPRLSRR